MTQESFPACPPGVVQLRMAKRTGDGPWGTTVLDALWRTINCLPGRWHWSNNPCKCYGPGIYSNQCLRGRTSQWVRPVSGSWRRDGQGIASQVQKFREQIRATRLQEVAARAAVGPRNVRKPVVFALDFESDRAWAGLFGRSGCPWCRICPGAMHWCSK